MQRREALRNTAFLAGCGLSMGTMASFVSGCNGTSGSTAAGTFLPSKTYGLLSDICETIIPRTDTPGAIDAGVPAFIDSSIKEFLTEEERTGLMAGLELIAEKAKTDHGKSFGELCTEQKEATLLAIDAMGGEAKIFRMLQGMTKQVYFTSEVGATQFLKYDPVPGAYKGCVPLSEVGGTWALS